MPLNAFNAPKCQPLFYTEVNILHQAGSLPQTFFRHEALGKSQIGKSQNSILPCTYHFRYHPILTTYVVLQ